MKLLKSSPKPNRQRKGFLLRRIVGDSMLPTFKPGHIALVVRGSRPVRVGDVVVVKHGGLEKIKRISEIKTDHIYVRGDNQDNSTDSRSFGWLHNSVLKGRVLWPRQLTTRDLVNVLFRTVGVLGLIICMAVFAVDPSWPTPDKLIVPLTFLFMIFGQAWAMLKRVLPFIAILLVYESFRGIVPHLNTHVNFMFMPDFDKLLFGGTLPTITLQQWLWHGAVQWYDFVFYGAYMLHFILPLTLAILIWKYHTEHYWRVIGTYLVVSFAGFLTFLLYPAAPPWMASDMHLIPEITRVSSHIFAAMGIQDFPSLYNNISPNPVAAVPSLHAAYATLFCFFVWKYFGRKWGLATVIYPLLIYLGTIYMGEHYFYDELLGAVYAIASVYATYALADKFWPKLKRVLRRSYRRLRSMPKEEPSV